MFLSLKKRYTLSDFAALTGKNPFHAALIFKRAFRLRAGKTKDEKEQKDQLEKKVKKQPTCCAAIKRRVTNYGLFHFCI